MKRFILTILTLSFMVAPDLWAEEDLPVFEIVGGVAQDANETKWIHEGWNGELTLGGAGVTLSRPSFKFGEYSGIEGTGGYAVAEGEFHYFKENRFLDVYADNLGLDNRRISLDYGKSNDYQFFGQWDQAPHLLFSENRTPYQGAGSSRLTLPAGFPRALSFNGTPIPNGTPVELKVDSRDEATLGIAKQIGSNRFDIQFNRVEKNGIRSIGGVVGSSPANPMAIILPAPIDFHTNEVRATFSRKFEDANIQLQYFGSFFDNRQDSLVFDSPFAGLTPFFDNLSPFALGPLPAQGRLSLEPDNQFHQVRLAGGWNPTTSTRLTATAEYGMSFQDEMLMPFAIGSSRALLPRQMADASINNLMLQLKATTSITPKVRMAAKFRHFQIDNNTPRALFMPIVNDTGPQRPITGDQSAFNLPVQYSQNQGNLDVSFQLFNATVLKAGYQVLHKDRDFRAIDESLENKISLSISSNELDWMSATASMTYARTDTDAYNFENVRSLRNTQQFLSSPRGPLLASPADFRKKDIAENDQIQSSLNLNFFPIENLTVGLSHNWILQQFPEQMIGLQEVQVHSSTIDITHNPLPVLSYSFFFTYDTNQIDQEGRAHNFATPGSINDPNRNYQVMLDDTSYTAGAGGEWLVFDNRLNLKADYSISKNISDIGFTAGSDPFVANPVDLPSVKTLLHQLNGSAEFNLSNDLTMGLRLIYENYSFDDFALDSINAQTVMPAFTFPVVNGETIALSNTIQDYEAYTGMMYVTYRFEGK